MRFGSWLVLQDKAFFNLLEQESDNVANAAHKLEEMITKFDRLEERRTEMKQLEHAGDVIVHDIYDKVNSTFVTPIDQDDITKLASLMTTYWISWTTLPTGLSCTR